MMMAVLTISDASWMKMRKDESGPAVKARLEGKGWVVPVLEILPDERPMIETRLRDLADSGDYSCIFTTGGTGPAPRDVTPEATSAVIERPMPGLASTACVFRQPRQVGEDADLQHPGFADGVDTWTDTCGRRFLRGSGGRRRHR